MKQTKFFLLTLFITLMTLTGCQSTSSTQGDSSTNHPKTSSSSQISQSSNTNQPATKQTDSDDLANLNYSNQQTITIDNNVPDFSTNDLSLKNGSWEKYGDLDHLNRVTYAEAMLNQDLMPKEKRGDISSVKPTGWRNKKLEKGYLYNRSHLIGFALAGENANWKNLMTGTQQLNNPEMLRHEMDIKYYLEQSPDNYVRYSVIPIFRDDELVARGVHMRAQSINSDAIAFNIYIFNVQDGVSINYTDGTSTLNKEDPKSSTQKKEEVKNFETTQNKSENHEEYVDTQGNGLIKGSNSDIYHIPGSEYYNKTTNPKAWFKTIEEAENAGYRPPKN